MQLNIKPKTGGIVKVAVEPTDTVEQVKLKIRETLNFTAEKCFVLFAGQHLDDAKTLADYHIQADFTLSVHEDQCGC